QIGIEPAEVGELAVSHPPPHGRELQHHRLRFGYRQCHVDRPPLPHEIENCLDSTVASAFGQGSCSPSENLIVGWDSPATEVTATTAPSHHPLRGYPARTPTPESTQVDLAPLLP